MSEFFITSYVNRYTISLYSNSYGIPSNAIDTLFNSTYANTQAKLDSLAATVLGQGIDFYTDENYDKAITSFKQAAALSPYSDNAASAYDYMGKAYINLEEMDKAINTYKEAIRLYPTNDEFYLALGDIYITSEDTLEEATQAYETAVKLNSNDAESRYSLGQCYLTAGKMDKAREQFKEVIRISPTNASGCYGLGQVARAEGDLSEAVNQLTKAINKDKKFELAYVELGYAFADQGEFNLADNQLSILEANDSNYATDLENYIIQLTPPQITSARSSNGFDTRLEAGTPVSEMHSGLSTANKSKLFSMTITFSKDMDALSVINSKNWTISRATLLKNGGLYNYGLPITSTEALISTTPAFVTFDEDSDIATVYFRISQNDDADATIDPEHIVFKFSGIDAYGKAMDTAADEYSGFSSIA